MDSNLIDILKDTIEMQKHSNRRLFVIVVILIVVIIANNIAWLLYESQYETITDEYYYEEYQDIEQDTEGSGNAIIGSGNVI